jgi:hypothetical protein
MTAPPTRGEALGPVRWLAAAALVLLQLGRLWEYRVGLPGGTVLVNQYNWYSDTLDLVPYYIPGTPGEQVFGYQAPARLFLVAAAAAAVVAATGRAPRLAPRVAVGALAGALVMALGGHQGDVVLVLALALALVGRPAWDGVQRRL